MKPVIRIRRANINDADVIGYHRAGMFRDMGQIPDHLFEAFKSRSIERVRELVASGEYVGWLASPAENPEMIVGGGGVHLRRVLPHPANEHAFAEGRHGLIINVFTEPEWRRQGVGELLMKEIIEWSKNEKLDRLVLHASEDGKRLYQRLGFVLTNEMKYVGNRKP
ncbi:MAG TPA: GNAT family N-acetyltransferase [Chthoniobacterales bacterium]|nr:GNAT family N-acetyltransferase [Chthoniobacterales bacterium]